MRLEPTTRCSLSHGVLSLCRSAYYPRYRYLHNSYCISRGGFCTDLPWGHGLTSVFFSPRDEQSSVDTVSSHACHSSTLFLACMSATACLYAGSIRNCKLRYGAVRYIARNSGVISMTAPFSTMSRIFSIYTHSSAWYCSAYRAATCNLGRELCQSAMSCP